MPFGSADCVLLDVVGINKMRDCRDIARSNLSKAVYRVMVRRDEICTPPRTVFDFSDLEKSVFVYQTGQSGWVQSKLYRNMNALWAKNDYLPLQMKSEKISRQLELSNK